MVKKYHAYKQVAKFTLTDLNPYKKDYGEGKYFQIYYENEALANPVPVIKPVIKFYYKLQADHIKLSPNARLAVLQFGFNTDKARGQKWSEFENPMSVYISNVMNKNEIKVIKSDGNLDYGTSGAHLLTLMDMQNYTNPSPDINYIELRNHPNFLNNLIEIVVDVGEYDLDEEQDANGNYYYETISGDPVFGFPEVHAFNLTLVVYDVDDEILNEGMTSYENKDVRFHNVLQQGSKLQI